jgi:hypothetical protein
LEKLVAVALRLKQERGARRIVQSLEQLIEERRLAHARLLVPRSLVPAVLALIHEHKASNEPDGEEERSLYAGNEEEQKTKEGRSDEI